MTFRAAVHGNRQAFLQRAVSYARNAREATPARQRRYVSGVPQTAVLQLRDVSWIRDERIILAPMSLTVRADERWLILGANGSGKTTLLRIASMYEHPSTGTVRVLGEQLGRTDVRRLRRRIGYLSAALALQLRPELSCLDIVRTARYAALEPWWHTYSADDDDQAWRCLQRMGVGPFAGRPLGTLSSGEQQRVLLARTLMNEPEVILLDEPSARLDLGGREQLVGALAELTTDSTAPPVVLVTHHLDEVPPGMTHVLMLRNGEVIARGPINRTLTAAAVSACFDIPLHLERRADGRLSAWRRADPQAAAGS
jgi:iron complex transport system ATP-binding protein